LNQISNSENNSRNLRTNLGPANKMEFKLITNSTPQKVLLKFSIWLAAPTRMGKMDRK